MRTHGLAACGAANLQCSPAPTGGRPSTAAPTSTPCAWPPRPRPVSASSAAARSSRRRVGPRCGHARRARPRAARAAPGPPIARGARRPRPAAVRGHRRRRGRTGHPSAQLREHGDRLREARVADRHEHDAIAELLPLALSAGISRRDRPEGCHYSGRARGDRAWRHTVGRPQRRMTDRAITSAPAWRTSLTARERRAPRGRAPRPPPRR
jgi:hypothetical protein